jgi:hypothetical protein
MGERSLTRWGGDLKAVGEAILAMGSQAWAGVKPRLPRQRDHFG